MNRIAKPSLVAAAAMLLSAMWVTPAFATPGMTTPCSGCHTGPNPAVSLSVSLVSADSTNATYSITVGNLYGMTGWGVFAGGTKLAGNALASSTFSVPVGSTYTVFGVSGNGSGTQAFNSTAISPVRPVPPATPTLAANYDTSANSVTISWPAVGGATSYDYQVGAGAIMNTLARSVAVQGLAPGATAFKLRATNSAGSSSYATASITYTRPVAAPGPPALQATYSTTSGSITITWTAVGGASAYDYQVGAGPVLSTAATSVSLSGMAVGTTAVKVRATNAVGSSAYTTTSIAYAPLVIVAPRMPGLASSYAAPSGSVTITWPAVSGATSYEYHLAGAPISVSDTNSVTLAGLVYGTSTLLVRAVNGSGSSAFAVASIVSAPPRAIVSLTVRATPRRYITIKGRVKGVSVAGRARIAVFIRHAGSGKYSKRVYSVATSSRGGFSARIKLPMTGRAYAIVSAFGASAKTRSFSIR